MFKFEDLWKDQIVMNLIFCSNMILKKVGLLFSLLTYNVLPTGTNSGMLQIVQNSTTFYSIDKNYQDIWHFFRLENYDGQLNPRQMYTKFLESAAVYSVISFLLNVGDRHLDNIMVTNKGEFFHIDYGFILGEEPTLKKALGSKSPVRIPQKMKDTILGGSLDGQAAYKEFTNTCCKIYLVLRKHYALFMNILSLLHTAQPKIDYQFSMEHVEQELTLRFMPNTSDKEAREIFEGVITNCGDAMVNYLTDFGHHMQRAKAFEVAVHTVSGVFNAVWGQVCPPGSPSGKNKE